MSIQRINQYYTEVFEVQTSSGAVKETSLKRYFANLVADYLLLYHKDSNKKLVDEVKLPNLRKQPDGAIIDSINFVFGYWEAKDDADDLEKELQGKINIGYPTENLLIQNQQKGILVRGEIREEFDMQNAKVLDKILRKYLAFEPAKIFGFRT
ncbi:MAG: hypothetical protein EAZ97_09735 [Bacteroidetes bacterium]|nr:MAG: hypothetical protein EAZ97_09735 [Bacteroidota bacterium]